MDDQQEPTYPAAIKKLQRRNSKAFILEKLTMKDFIYWRAADGRPQIDLVYVTTQITVREALALMTEKNVLSVPVWDPVKLEFVVFLSLVDIFRFCMENNLSNTMNDMNFSDTLEVQLSEIVQQILNEDGAHVEVIAFKNRVSMVMEWFALGIHRVLVIQDKESCAQSPSGYIVSQSDILLYLYQHASESEPIVSKTLEEQGFFGQDTPTIGPHKLIQVTRTETALGALRHLYLDRANAVAIVDDEGKLLDELSITDLTNISETDGYTHLLLPVLDFLRTKTTQRSACCTCSRHFKLKEVIQILVENRSHRVWVVDQGGKLEGIITLTDIICKFAPFDYKLLHSKKI